MTAQEVDVKKGSNGKGEPQDRFAAVDVFLAAHDDASPERRRFSDDPGLNVIQKFTNPDEPRTMGRVSRAEAYWASVVHAQGASVGCDFLTDWIRTRMILSRSEDAWGSHQAADVARTVPRESAPRRPFLGLFGGRRQ